MLKVFRMTLVIFLLCPPFIGYISHVSTFHWLYFSCVHLSLVIFLMCPPFIGHIYLSCVHLSLVIPPKCVHTFDWTSFTCDHLSLVIILLWSPVIGRNSPVVICHWSSFFSCVQPSLDTGKLAKIYLSQAAY